MDQAFRKGAEVTAAVGGVDAAVVTVRGFGYGVPAATGRTDDSGEVDAG